MEIISSNYSYRNPFVAGFLPAILNGLNDDDQVDNRVENQNKKPNLNKKNRPHQSMKSLHVLVTTSVVQSTSTNPTSTRNAFSLSLSTTSSNQDNQITTTSCQINLSQPNSLNSNTTSENTSSSSKQLQIYKSTGAKSKKNQKNKRQRQARQAKRELKKQRHVHFPPDDCIHVVYLLEDDECDIDCRAKYWEFFVSDRARFRDRLKILRNTLDSVLSSSHRERIYKERFECSEDSGIENSTNTDTDYSDRDENDEEQSDHEISLSITLTTTTTLHFYKPT